MKVFIAIFIFFFSAIIVFAQSNNSQKIPEGMEVIKIGGGGGQLIVPKGAKTRQVGAQIIVEGTKEYMSRMIYEMGERLTKIEKSQEDLKKEVETLKDIIKEMQKNPGLLGSSGEGASLKFTDIDQGTVQNRQIETIDGTVNKVDAVGNTIVVKTGDRQMAFSVAVDAKINRGDENIKLQDVEETDSVTVLYYSPSSGTYVAVSIADNSRAR